jgi:hypothetical protein
LLAHARTNSLKLTRKPSLLPHTFTDSRTHAHHHIFALNPAAMAQRYPPFCSDSPQETYRKVMAWRETLVLPPECTITPEAEDLIRQLCTDADRRIGKGGADEIKVSAGAFERVG